MMDAECRKNEKMTLKGYYNSLPVHSAPRYELLKAIADRCEVSIQTARNWCLYGIKPRSYMHVKVIVELTGLNEEQLWTE